MTGEIEGQTPDEPNDVMVTYWVSGPWGPVLVGRARMVDSHVNGTMRFVATAPFTKAEPGIHARMLEAGAKPKKWAEIRFR